MKEANPGLNKYLGITITLDEILRRRKNRKRKNWMMRSPNY